MEKLLTVSIAAYNVAGCVQVALDSLVRSAVLDRLDVIVVDDGSKDTTAEVVLPYVERYPDSVRLLRKENGGYGSTINASFAQARGKYYRLLDGDDAFDTSELERLVALLADCEADMAVAQGFIEVYPDHERVVTLQLGAKGTSPIAELTDAEHVPMHALVARTEALRTHPHTVTEHCFYTDEEFVFWALSASRTFAVLPVRYYRYALGLEGQSVSLSGSSKHYRDGIRCYQKLTETYRQYAPNPLLLRYLADYLQAVYTRFLCIEPTKEHYAELKDYQHFVTVNTPQVYDYCKARKVTLLRCGCYPLYRLICRVYQRGLS